VAFSGLVLEKVGYSSGGQAFDFASRFFPRVPHPCGCKGGDFAFDSQFSPGRLHSELYPFVFFHLQNRSNKYTTI
jgi:hypothetical protein